MALFLFFVSFFVDFGIIPRTIFLPDADGDGIIDSRDCDDGDPTIAIGMMWGPDIDGDGYGDLDLRAACICLPQGVNPSGDYVDYKPGCD